uniref:G-protein coupled receptors family 1 profile domain-containing protein n=1 Tax=Oreochromis aureus TaxID=47969 RepID=A0AAZ1X3V8_OREAU
GNPQTKTNSTQVLYFTLTAYFDTALFKYLYFISVMSLYMFTVGSNVLLIVVICVNRSLHEPMYMFLCSLFVNELYGSTGLFPFLLLQILSDVHTVSAPLCFLQVYCLCVYGSVEFFILGVMSYLAICYPLQYNTRMTRCKVVVITAFMWFYSTLTTAVVICLSASLQLCGNIIHRVYCHNSILNLICSDTPVNDVLGYLFSLFLGLMLLIIYSYMRILKVCFSGSKQTRQKAVSTCTPHLASLINFHPSIHLHPLYPRPGRGGSSLSREAQTSLSPRVLGLPRGLLPVGHARNTSPRRRPGGILVRCPNHLNWLLSMWRSSGSTLSPSRMAELLTLSLRERPATLRRKPISAACIRDLVLSVTTHSSWP